MDSFVSGILDGQTQAVPTAAVVSGVDLLAPREEAGSSGFLRGDTNSFSAQHKVDGPRDSSATRNSDTHAVNGPKLARGGKKSRHSTQTIQSLFGYALIFINFTFVVASMLLIMSGIVARRNAAVSLCVMCGRITLTALVLGVILCLFAIFGFIWIRQRQMVFLLVYVGFLVVLLLTLLILIVIAAVYDRDTEVSLMDPSRFLDAWERGVIDTINNQSFSICFLQERFNCSGFHDGCCVPEECYNESSPPLWVEKVCPICPNFPPMSPIVCTDVVYSTVRKNLSGFLVISSFAMILVIAGVAFAILLRRAARLMTVVR